MIKKLFTIVVFIFILCSFSYAYVFGQNEFGTYCIDDDGNLVVNTWVADDFDGDGYSELRHINEAGFLDVDCTIDGNYINNDGYSTTDGISIAKYQTNTFEAEIGIRDPSIQTYFWMSDHTTTKTMVSLDCPIGYITPEINITNYKIKPSITLEINTMCLADFQLEGTADLPEGTVLDIELKMERHNVAFHRIVYVYRSVFSGNIALGTMPTNQFDWQGKEVNQINGEYSRRSTFLYVPNISKGMDYDIISVVSVKKIN